MSGTIPQLQSVLELLASGFRRLRVLVVGDIMLDRYIVGEVERISPEAPVPVLRYVHRYQRPGGAANVAVNLAGLGCQAVLAGLWGQDSDRVELEQLLAAAGVDTTGVVTGALPTISKTRIIGRTQQLLRLDVESLEQTPKEDVARLTERATALVNKTHAVVLSDYAKGALSNELCGRLIQLARQTGIPTFVDPKTPDLSKYAGATAVCSNLHELAIATGIPTLQSEKLFEAGDRQRRRYDLQALVVTMSEKGIQVLTSEGRLHSPARAREVFDVSGAGDTVIAVLAASLGAGLRIETAVELANLAAGVVVGKVGTIPIAHDELTALLTRSHPARYAQKVLSREQLLAVVVDWRAAGDSIVFTNGCFDLLHVGHVTLIEECRRFGSKVVLGLNTDGSVRRLKGPNRPIVGEQDRARVMAALGAVDAVTLFDEETPSELIQALSPDVLVKGADYTVGDELVLAAGGRVETIPMAKGLSTTAIVKRLQNNNS
jgi:D-beta-D-heptose 7-phosphate kinase / D-beta-D-heptose 1-phosphate adenosyltransferase